MGKISIEEAVKELDRMSKRMKRVASILQSLAYIDNKFEKKADEMMSASLISEEWSESIYKEYIEKKENERRVDS